RADEEPGHDLGRGRGGRRSPGGRRCGRVPGKRQMSATSPTDALSYYGRPIIKEPVWESDIPLYFFTGGLAGASDLLALGAQLSGNHRLRVSAVAAAAAGAAVSPYLLIKDPGRPPRFLNMLRVFKITSTTGVGTW